MQQLATLFFLLTSLSVFAAGDFQFDENTGECLNMAGEQGYNENVLATCGRLQDQRLNGGIAKGSSLKKLQLHRVSLVNEDFEEIDFFRARFEDVSARDFNGTRSLFEEASFERVDLRFAHLRETLFKKAKLIQVDFSYANLRHASLYAAELRGVRLNRAKLYKANLDFTIAARTSFRGADLRKASFHKANLKYADFGEANLEGALFWGADLRGANLHAENVKAADFFGARVNRMTRMPFSRSEAIVRGMRFVDEL